MIKKCIKNIFLILSLNFFLLNLVNASNINLKDLEKQVQELSKKVQNMENNNNSLSGFKFKGRINIEYYWDDKKISAKPENLNLRKAKLCLGKKISENVYFDSTIVAYRTDHGGLHFSDIGFYYMANKNLEFGIGEIFVPMSLESELSSEKMPIVNYTNYTFSNFNPDKALGVNGKYILDTYGISFGIFGNSLGDKAQNKGQFITALRTYYLPYKDKNSLIHLGLNGYYRTVKEVADPVKETKRFGTELLLVSNNFSFASEYAKTFVDPSDANLIKKNLNLHYYYAQVSLVLTGEKYDYSSGVIKSYKVAKPLSDGGFGSFELAIKYLGQETNNPINSSFNVANTTVKELAVSFNWSPENKFRNFLTYTKVDLDGFTYNKVQLVTKIFF